MAHQTHWKVNAYQFFFCLWFRSFFSGNFRCGNKLHLSIVLHNNFRRAQSILRSNSNRKTEKRNNNTTAYLRKRVTYVSVLNFIGEMPWNRTLLRCYLCFCGPTWKCTNIAGEKMIFIELRKRHHHFNWCHFKNGCVNRVSPDWFVKRNTVNCALTMNFIGVAADYSHRNQTDKQTILNRNSFKTQIFCLNVWELSISQMLKSLYTKHTEASILTSK